MSKIHLLEPYRSALISLGYESGFVHVNKDYITDESDVVFGKKQNYRDELLKIMMIFDEVSIAWLEAGEDPVFANSPIAKDAIRAKGLENSGVAKLLDESILGAKNLDDLTADMIWQESASALIEYAPLIASQRAIRERFLSEDVIKFLAYFKSGNTEKAFGVKSNVTSSSDHFLIRQIEAGTLNANILIEIPVMNDLYQCQLASKFASTMDVKIAGTNVRSIKYENGIILDSAPDAIHMISVTINELLGSNLELPLPSNLQELIKIKNSSEMVNFRNHFHAIMENATYGCVDIESSVRRDIQACLKQFRRSSKVSSLSNAAAWLGLGNDAIGALSSALPGHIGIILSLTSFAASYFANKDKEKSKWLIYATKKI